MTPRGKGARPLSAELERLIQEVGEGKRRPVYLVGGDRVLCEPAGRRLAAALASADGVEISVHLRPPQIAPVLDDLRTMSLFSSAKVLLVIESALFADRASAADLIDQAAEGGAREGDLSPSGREAAASLLQTLRLFGVDPGSGEPAELLAALPSWAFQGGSALRKKRRGRGRGKKQVRDLIESLNDLLTAALEAGLKGWGDSGAAVLGDILDRGLPDGHSLVLAESVWARDHPVAARLLEQGAVVDAGGLAVDRRGSIEGLGLFAAELERETGTAIESAALTELARRTIKKSAERGRYDTIDADSSARLAAEFRKLAGIASASAIDLDLVRSTVEDRGEEDVWALLDDVGAGRAGPALERLRRIEIGAADTMASRLSLFSLVADYCRQLVAVRGLLREKRVPAGESSYQRFKNQWAPTLQSPLAGGLDNPIARLHPYRLHRVYLAASRISEKRAASLPEQVLLTEARIKGESGAAATALAALVSSLALGARPTPRRR